MSAARRRRVGVGDRVILAGGRERGGQRASGTLVRLADDEGAVEDGHGGRGLADSGRFATPAAGLAAGTRRPETGLEGLPPEAVEEASWWEAHIAEVVYGLRPDAPAGTRPRPAVRPGAHEPDRAGEGQGRRAVGRGEAGPGQHGQAPPAAVGGSRACPAWSTSGSGAGAARRAGRWQVAAAMRQAIGEAADASSQTAAFVIWRTREILAEEGRRAGAVATGPSYRLFGPLSAGGHTTGSASTRRSLAGRPEGMFGPLPAAAPGEVVQIDSTPLDVLVLLDDGVPGRVELTGMIDVATRVVPAAVLRPDDEVGGRERAAGPCPDPGADAAGLAGGLKMAHSALPYERLLDIDARLEHAAARPVIVPDTIVIDHGNVFVSAAFRAACRHLGI